MPVVDRVLIVGAGIAGLTLACALRRKGISAELVERNASWQSIGAGIAVQGNAVRVLHALDLARAVANAGTPIDRWMFADQGGIPLCTVDLTALWRDAGPCIGIERSRLQDILLQAAADVPIRLGTTVTSLYQSRDCVSLRFNDGSSGEYDLVVGADGIASGVRALAFDTIAPVYTGHMVWRSIVRTSAHVSAGLCFLLGDGCFFGVCPVRDGGSYGFGNIVSPRMYDPVPGRLDRLRTRFRGFGSPIREYLGFLQSDAQIHCAPIEVLEEIPWQSDRILLIGDAAHASSPMLGQGGAMAMEDALVLAESLHSAPTLSVALSSYVSRRKPRVAWVQEASRTLGEALRLAPAERNEILRHRGAEMLQNRIAPLNIPP